MANHIQNLQDKVAIRNAAIGEARYQIQNFLEHLNSSKFTGFETDGSRRDWIATGDVIKRLQELRSALIVD